MVVLVQDVRFSMTSIKTSISEVEVTPHDQSIVKFNGELYYILNQLGDKLTIIPRKEYDLSIGKTLNSALNTDKFIESLKEQP